MITRRTKLQLIVFALITMLGVSYVGARYARLDRLISDQSYSVVGHFADSGGIFTGAEVSYRGVTVGRVVRLRLTGSGVDVTLRIEKDFKDIPRDTRAVVANRSAVGEQFVDLQPQTRKRPYLQQGSTIPQSMTATPIAATTLVTDLDDTVESVNKKSLRTTVDELVSRRRQRELRRHHRPAPGQQHGAGHPDRQDVGDPELLPRPLALQRHRGRQRR
jgi:phospholipid/cholesterol/gamma-HCH transport system substrate-binding protein